MVQTTGPSYPSQSNQRSNSLAGPSRTRHILRCSACRGPDDVCLMRWPTDVGVNWVEFPGCTCCEEGQCSHRRQVFEVIVAEDLHQGRTIFINKSWESAHS
jgi:hypothetical protein